MRVVLQSDVVRASSCLAHKQKEVVNVRFHLQSREFFDVQPGQFYSFCEEYFVRKNSRFLRVRKVIVQRGAGGDDPRYVRVLDHEFAEMQRAFIGERKVFVKRYIVRANEPFSLLRQRLVFWPWPFARRGVLARFMESTSRAFYVSREGVAQWDGSQVAVEEEVFVPRKRKNGGAKRKSNIPESLRFLLSDRYVRLPNGAIKKRDEPRVIPGVREEEVD